MLGYLYSIQGKGCYVLEDLDSRKATGLELRDLQPAIDILDLMEVIEILECDTARLASHRADAEAIDRIRNTCLKMKENIKDLNRFIENDFEFRIALASASRNKFIFGRPVKMMVSSL